MPTLYRLISSALRFLGGFLLNTVLRPVAVVGLLIALCLSLWFSGATAKNSSLLPFGRKPPVPSVDKSAAQFAEKIVARCPQPKKTLTKILIAPIQGDRDALIENAIRHSFQARSANGWYDVLDRTVTLRALEKIHSAFGSSEYPKEWARIGGAEYVLIGNIIDFAPSQDSHSISGTFRLFDVTNENAEELFNVQIDAQPEKTTLVNRYGNFGFQTLSVLLFLFLFPIMMIPVIKMVVAKENNGINLTAMLLLASIPVGIALLIYHTVPTNAVTVIAALCLFALSAAWTGAVMNKIAEV